VNPTAELRRAMAALGLQPLQSLTTALALLRRPELTYAQALELARAQPAELSEEERRQVEIEARYEGYIRRQRELVARTLAQETAAIPPDFDYRRVHGLSTEALQKLERIRPRTLGQAARIPGLTPSAVTLIMLALRRPSGKGNDSTARTHHHSAGTSAPAPVPADKAAEKGEPGP